MIKRFASLFGRFFCPTSLLFAPTLVFFGDFHKISFCCVFFFFSPLAGFSSSSCVFCFSTTRAPCARAKSVNNKTERWVENFLYEESGTRWSCAKLHQLPSTEAAPRGRKKNTFQFSQFVFEGELFFPFCIFILFSSFSSFFFCSSSAKWKMRWRDFSLKIERLGWVESFSRQNAAKESWVSGIISLSRWFSGEKRKKRFPAISHLSTVFYHPRKNSKQTFIF